MLVCSCNRICHRCIEGETTRRFARDPLQLLTPTAVYVGLGHRPRCGGCLPLAARLIQEKSQSLREAADAGAGQADACCHGAGRSG